ncbi:hypothetical protein [Streptomyces minutiscleroticus]|uniref:Uncharacterized protein n=1 Tax=Streptomyces minutiscleroticus TaxID=68238 RepID=A0A918U463_9ACTN|nr:hypothetical protein [Streptomyces minutiscleroticus]GGX89816.1 hypothetical protein GCM10010358_49720 [Streptomyces minutiscleroticus]
MEEWLAVPGGPGLPGWGQVLLALLAVTVVVSALLRLYRRRGK